MDAVVSWAMTNRDTRGLGRRLRVSRIWAGLEQQDVADRMHVSRSTVSSWERGRTQPNIGHFAEWSRMTEQTMEWLAGDVALSEANPPTPAKDMLSIPS